ncbi:DUF4166 domain-containing protein [Pelagibius sp.]|uniref:DUF4166 domain-containing protein n=1 Tax=Pelagibius sp. TaxID=1931238 RepID=UPI003BB108CD
MTTAESALPLYRRVLGDDFERLPGAVKRLHDHSGQLCANGLCRVSRGSGVVSRVIARLFALPPSGESLPVRVCFIAEGEAELWERDFAGHRLKTRQGGLAGRPGLIYETFGPGRFIVRPRVMPHGLDLELLGVRLLGLPLPRLFWPRIRGHEGEDAGRFTFDVAIMLPLVGLLVAYSGFLEPQEETPASRDAREWP